MSKYTTEVRFICESSVGLVESKGFNDLKNILTQAAPKVFDFEFPIFDESYRLPLETKILRHYYTREISEETVGLWKLRLQDRLNMIMPYYNQMYKSELLEFNPLYDVDLNTTHSKENEGKTDTTSDLTGLHTKHGTTNDTENGEFHDTTHGNNTQSGTSTRNDTSHSEVDDTENVTRKDTSHTETNGTTNGSKDDTENTTGSGTSNTKTTNKTDDTVTTSNKSDTTDSGTVHKTGTSWQLYSDTPQGAVDGIAHATDDIAADAYLTNATKNTTDEDTTTNGKSNGTTSGTRTTDGSSNGTSNTDTSNTGKRTLNSTSKETTTNTGDTTVDSTNKTTENTTSNGTLESNGKTTSNGEYFETKDDTNKVTRNGEQDFTLNDTENKTGTEKMTSTEDYVQHVAGKRGSMTYSKMLTEFRETFLNIDKMIIDELSDLFFGLW